jgi:tetratricopeptide (TPR) repeat protein
VGFVFGATHALVVQGIHALFPKRLHQKPVSRELALISELLVGITKPYFFTDMLKLGWSHLRGMNLAEQLPPSRELAFHYAQHCMLMSLVLRRDSRSLRYFERAAELNNVFNDLWGMAYTNSYRGLGLYGAARYEDAIEYFNKAIDSFGQTGDMWELNVTRFHLGLCHYALGDLSAAIELAKETFDLSVRIGDPRSHCSSYLWARATNGNLLLDELKSCYTPMPEDIVSTVNAMKAESLWHLAQGRAEKAVSGLERAWDLAKKNVVIMTHTVAALPLLVNALRVHADAIETEDPRQSQRLRKRALRIAKRTAWFTRFFPTELPYSLRELSLVYAATGKLKKALRAADKSCAIAKRQNAKYEHAKSLLVRGQLAQQLGLPEASDEIDAATAVLRVIEAPLGEISGGRG